MNAGDLSPEGGTVFYSYGGKGSKGGRRERPRTAFVAFQSALAAWGKTLDSLKPEDSIWTGLGGTPGTTSGTFYGRLRRYLEAAGLPLSGVHVFSAYRGEVETRCRGID
jgi:hypothetical protein